ncbi:multiple sugar transport system substrate-binding protein [Metabacillus crassostreae]|uniref:ABC transporter substrate-binding protein n=1 Tax=Metabacillus crassostreae TaxID=929098 RepID=UPI001EF77642|nr:sugar ABC transporter substrate-binding protein [Metabacillus crassostreae]MBM7603129.1 multiple sugar transport system substrate-binding protein [Metabacillus crassostreae]
MRYQKIWGTLMTSALAVSLVLSGCSSKETTEVKDSGGKSDSSDQKVTLTFWDENAGPQRTPIWEELISRFEAKNPNIDVEYVGLPKDSAKQKLDAAIAADDMPDVASLQTSWLPEFSLREALLPLDDYFSQWNEKDKINKSAVEFNIDIVLDNKLYGIPYTQNLDILWYRADWFKEASISPPESWDEFFTAIKSMTDKDNNRYGFTIRGGAGGSFQLQRMLYAYSGIEDYITEDGKSTINDPKHVKFLEEYLSLYKEYTPKSDITNGYKEMIAGFDTGAVAMVHHNIGSYGEHSESLEEGQYAALPLPKSEDGKYVAEGGNTIGISVFKTTENPDAAWELVSFLNSAESQSYWNEQVGQIPTNSDVLNEEWVQNSQHIETAFKVYEDPNLVLYKPAFYLPDYRSILDNVVDPGTQSVMSGKTTVQEFLDEWAKAIEDSQKKYEEHVN